jgi:hypothetical protein
VDSDLVVIWSRMETIARQHAKPLRCNSDMIAKAVTLLGHQFMLDQNADVIGNQLLGDSQRFRQPSSGYRPARLFAHLCQSHENAMGDGILDQ